MAASDFKVVNNVDKFRFEVLLEGEYAYIDYKYYKQDIAFIHTTVPEIFRGRGIAGAMAVTALNFARDQRRKILFFCPFVLKYVREHPEYYFLVDVKYHPSFRGKNK